MQTSTACDRTSTACDRTVAHHVLDDARRRGTPAAFGVHGANIEDVYAAAPAVGLPAVVAKHEFAAGAMADGVARITGKPGLVLTTSGGGAMNVIPALAESYDSRVPVLAVIGSAPSTLVAQGAFQDMLSPPDTIDLVGVLSAVTGFCGVVESAAALDDALAAAAACLDSDRPAALVIPKDVQQQCFPALSDRQIATPARGQRPAMTPPPDLHAPDLHAVASELAAIARAGKPVVLWVGEEASYRQVGRHIRTIAGRLGATVIASPGGVDATGLAWPPGVTGVMGHRSARSALSDASLCLAIGCRMSITDRAGADEVLTRIPVIHLGRHRPRLPGCRHVSLSSLADGLDALDDALAQENLTVQRRPPQTRTVLETPAPSAAASRSEATSMREAVQAISTALPDNAVVFADAGNIGATAVHHLELRPGQRFGVALGMGGMGYAIAAGIGVAITEAVSTRCRCVVLAGDGSFFMHGMEFHTAIEYDAPITLVVVNNNAHGMCVTRESLYFPQSPSINRFRTTHIGDGLAAMFPDIDVRRPTDPMDLRAACTDLFAADGPNCLVVETDSDEIPPFLPFLARGES